MKYRTIKHSEVEAEYTKEYLENFYKEVKEKMLQILFETPYEQISVSDYYYLDDTMQPVPYDFAEKIYKTSIKRVFDYSIIEDLV